MGQFTPHEYNYKKIIQCRAVCGLYVIDCVFKMMTGLKYVMALNIIFFYTSNKHYADAVHEPQRAISLKIITCLARGGGVRGEG